MQNVNTAYEQLAQAIFQAISHAEGFQTIDVQHNVKKAGRSGCSHQIDVYWEVKVMGMTHRVAVECKNFGDEVPIGRIRDFFGVLHDLGDVNGIVVTKVGFQSGAKAFADHYKIVLKELRTPTEADWAGRLKSISITSHVRTLEITARRFDIDVAWVLQNTNYKQGDQFSVSGDSDKLCVLDEIGRVIATFHQIENALPRDTIGAGLVARRDFTDAYVLDNAGQRIKVNGIDYTYNVLGGSDSTLIEGEQIAKAILKDVKSGSIVFFDGKDTVRSVRPDA